MDVSLFCSAGWKRKFKQSALIEDNTPFYLWIYTLLSKSQLFPSFLSLFHLATEFLRVKDVEWAGSAGEMSSPVLVVHCNCFQAPTRTQEDE